MELLEALRTRRMVRSYDADRPVDPAVVEMCLKRAIRSPSAGHTRGRRFLALTDITSRELFWTATSDGPPDTWRTRMQRAPVLIVLYADPQAYRDRYAQPDKAHSPLARLGNDWPIPYWHVDSGMAAMALMLAAHDQGLGSCFFGVPPDRWTQLADAFAVPAGLEPVGVISLGHPAVDDRTRPSRAGGATFAESVVYGSFAPPG